MRISDKPTIIKKKIDLFLIEHNGIHVKCQKIIKITFFYRNKINLIKLAR